MPDASSVAPLPKSAGILCMSIPLGGSEQPSSERQGEAIFYDARRSLDQWYSCHSCHYDGGSNADENLLCLCPTHHRRGVHEGRLRIHGRVTPDRDQLTFEFPFATYEGEVMVDES